MTHISKYTPGTFSWVDLITSEAVSARAFYSQLFAWDIVENDNGNDGIYTQFQCQGVPVAGMGEMNAEMKASGMPSVWNSYVSVENVEASTERARELGATVQMPPMQITDAGQMAIIADPLGAVVSLWQPGAHIGAGLVNEPVSLCWNELSTTDVDAAAAFYSALFGWSVMEPDDTGYRIIKNGNRENGGILELGDEREASGIPPHWMVYLAVEDCDAVLNRATELGGQVLMPGTDVPPGRFGVLTDAQGGTLTVMKVNAPD